MVVFEEGVDGTIGANALNYDEGGSREVKKSREEHAEVTGCTHFCIESVPMPVLIFILLLATVLPSSILLWGLV